MRSTSIDDRIVRGLIYALLIVCIIAVIAIPYFSYQILVTLTGVDPDVLASEIPTIDPSASNVETQIIIYTWLVQRYSGIATIVVGILALFSVIFFTIVILQVHRSQKVRLWGLEFERTNALQDAQRDISGLRGLVTGLQENLRELSALNVGLNQFVRNPTEKHLDALLDKVSHTAAFVIRPSGRSVRTSVWLYSLSKNEIRIISGYRISEDTKAKLRFKKRSNGFAPAVLRHGGPYLKDTDFSDKAKDWKTDESSDYETTSIIGQPIEVGTTKDDWQVILCFSTDREDYKFGIEKDAAELNLFSNIISSILTIAQFSYDQSDKSMLEFAWERYDD